LVGEEFEGFQGSGGLAPLKRPSGAGGDYGCVFVRVSLSFPIAYSPSQQSRESFGHFASAPPRAEEDDEEADLDGTSTLTRSQKKKVALTRLDPRICVTRLL
jgi:hypothetical protein